MKYGHWKHHRGRFADGIWIFSCIEVCSGELRLEIIPDIKRSEENMMALLKKHVELDNVIISDQHKAYHNITKHGFLDNHSIEFVTDDEWRVHTNNIKGQCNIKPVLDLHLCEFLWRKHVKRNQIDPFLFLNGQHRIFV